jgi:hypothetical protein
LSSNLATIFLLFTPRLSHSIKLFSLADLPLTQSLGNFNPMYISWPSVLAGGVFGLLTAIGPWFQGLSIHAAALFSAGLLLTYTSIGLLGAVFTAVPYPLTADAPAYYREFAGGGIRAATLTLIFGALAGAVSGFFRRRRP